jgi:YVTN family beta-propeller protein
LRRRKRRFMNVKVWKLLGLLLIIVFAFSASNFVDAVGVTNTITVGTSPTGIVYDSKTNEIYVANSGYNTVSVISCNTKLVVATVTVGISPTGLAYDSVKGEIFVTNHGSNTVSVISESNHRILATIPVGTNPNNLAYDPDKNEVFVVCSGDNKVSVISDTSNTVVANITVGTNPNKVIYDAGQHEVFVSNSGYNTVSVISDINNLVVATITVGNSPAGAAYDSAKAEVFVANYGSGFNSVSVISDSNNSVIATIPVGTTPYGVAYDSGTNEIFVSNHASNTVSVISDTNNTVVATIPLGTKPAGVTYNPVKGEIWVTNLGDNTVSVITDSSVSSPSTSPGTSSSPTASASATSNPSGNPSSNPTPSSESNLLQQVWVPTPTNAALAVGVTVLIVGLVSAVFSAVSNQLGKVGGEGSEKTKDLVPDKIKDWLQEVVASRREKEAVEKVGSLFKPTGPEIVAYIVAIIVLGISFAYVKVITLSQIWVLLPVFILTSIIVGFVQKFVSIAYLRSKGVWSEHSIWPLGLILFLFTTFAFRVPFSSPTRSTHSKKYSEHLGATAAVLEILISLVFAGFFFVLLKVGYPSVGGAGLSMCVIGSFFGTFPIPPMSGRDIFKHSKGLWAGLFVATLAVFVAWLMLM